MSATGRNLPGAERHTDDFYATPPWCVEALLRGSNLPSGRWLEPRRAMGPSWKRFCIIGSMSNGTLSRVGRRNYASVAGCCPAAET